MKASQLKLMLNQVDPEAELLLPCLNEVSDFIPLEGISVSDDGKDVILCDKETYLSFKE